MSQPLLFDAVKSGNLSQLNAALQGAEVNAAGEGGVTPLMLAASLGQLDMVKALLAAGADVSVRDEREYTALMHGVYNPDLDRGFPEVVQALIAAGADMLNDVSAGRFDPDMLPVAGRLQVPIFLMHMQGEPRTMQLNPKYQDVVQDIRQFMNDAIRDFIHFWFVVFCSGGRFV